ncbi:MAG TPA: YqgE/AlgH family protein [Crocinitomicaceae bacterium]|nr:YqgE/AlgH family protein [Crocinitomicaceae bacterium]
MIDFNFENNNQLIAGSILVAEPFLDDDYFSRAVILLCDHNIDGSFGFVLNKYVDTNISDFVDGFPEIDAKISIGGPVDMSNLFYIHSLGDEIDSCVPTSNGLFIGGDFNDVKSILTKDPLKASRIRFFIGYSGWDKGQLKEEMTQKSWLILNDVTKEKVLNTSNDKIWSDSLKEQGGKFKAMTNFPINPSNN